MIPSDLQRRDGVAGAADHLDIFRIYDRLFFASFPQEQINETRKAGITLAGAPTSLVQGTLDTSQHVVP